MNLKDTLSILDNLDDSLTICVAKSPDWKPESQAELCPAAQCPHGCAFPYFLEVSVAKNVLRAWSFARGGLSPNLDLKCKAVISYAENDAYLLPEDD